MNLENTVFPYNRMEFFSFRRKGIVTHSTA